MRFILVHPFRPSPAASVAASLSPGQASLGPLAAGEYFRQFNGGQSRDLYSVVRDVLWAELQLGNSLMILSIKSLPKNV